MNATPATPATPETSANPLGLRSPLLARALGAPAAARINGRGAFAASGKTFAVRNPVDNSILTEVADLAPSDLGQALAAAEAARPDWSARTAKERSALLKRWHALILENAGDLARIMTLEQGKPLAESAGEVGYGASFVEWFAEEAKRAYGEIIPQNLPDRRLLVLRQPVGMVGCITPWNFPIAMITRKAAPALAVGCTVIAKPARETPLSALALAVLAEEAGLPPGVFNVVVGTDARGLGKVLTGDARVRKFSFTGSTEVGKELMRACADTVKKISLELGGNAPFLVFDDADLEAAVEGAVQSKFRNAGQTCVCANRILVQDGIYDAFATRLGQAVAALKVGNGLDEGVEQGPLINASAVEKVEAHIADGIARGGKILTGGKAHALGGNFFEPTVMLDATPDMLCGKEETFGPLAPLFRFRDEAQAIALANDTPFGLAAYAYTRDLARAFRVGEALECGMVGLNTGVFSTEVAPFGGVKESGLGREGSHHGLEEFIEVKFLCLAGMGS